MIAKMQKQAVASLWQKLTDQLRQYCSDSVGRAVYYNGFRPKLLQLLDELPVDLLELDEPMQANANAKLLYTAQYVELLRAYGT